MANISDRITDTRNAARPASTTVTSGRSAGGTTLVCASLTGWPTASKVHFVTYTIDSNSNPVAGTQLDCRGIVSGNNIGSFVVLDGTDTGNSVGDIVEMLPTASWGQDLADALTAEHTRTGLHTGITTNTITVSSGTTLPAGDIGTADLATDAVTAAKLADDSVFPANLTSGLSGSSWAWTSWTPTWANFTVGNGTLNYARYNQIGKTVRFAISFTLGSSSAMGTEPTFTLPVTASGLFANNPAPIGIAILTDTGTTNFSGWVLASSTTVGTFVVIEAAATYARFTVLSSGVPMTWAATDIIWLQGAYEAA